MKKQLLFVATLVAGLEIGLSANARAPQCTNKTIRHRPANANADEFQRLDPSRDVSPLEKYVARLYVHLTGAPAPMFDPRFKRAVSLVQSGKSLEAAQLVITDPGFLKVRVRGFAIPFIDIDHRKVDTLTDFQTLIIGVTRDELDARLILTGNLRYSGYTSLSLPAVSRENNDHYAQFEARDLDFERDLERVDKQWDDTDYVAGALTTRAWASAYYNMGTNRLAVKYTIDAFQCQPIDSWKIRGLPDYFVRRDIDRAPGGDPSVYQNTCRNCHAAMDGIGGAFAKFDFAAGVFSFRSEGVMDKMNKNSYFYPAGFVTTDDSWTNLLSGHPTVDFQWHGPFEGNGVGAFAKTIADSGAFSRCMVEKTFAETCGKSIRDEAPELLKSLTADFEKNGCNLKDLFAKVATQDACIAFPTEVK